jgi:hypothetical protein
MCLLNLDYLGRKTERPCCGGGGGDDNGDSGDDGGDGDG